MEILLISRVTIWSAFQNPVTIVIGHEKTGLMYIHKIHLLILQYVSPLLLKIL